MSPKQTDRLFIGCLHLDSNYAIKYRPYAPQDKVEYNNFIINQINKFTTENTQLYLLGDVCDSKNSWKLLDKIVCKDIILIAGNHDSSTSPHGKLRYVKDIQGANILGDIMMTHIPIHPQELEYGIKFNIHAHSHYNSIQDPRYLNLSFDTFRRPINQVFAKKVIDHNTDFFQQNKRLPVISFDEHHNFVIEGFKED
jgi:calcineurin-like phosphoesterase family protein